MNLSENKSNSSNHNERPQGILTVPRADYLLWCKRRMESCDNSNVSNNNNNSHLYTDAGSCSTALDNKKVSTTTVASGSPFGFALPPELLLEILSYLKESQSALYAVSLVCRQWMLCAAPILYRHAKIGDTFRYATFILTLTRTKQTLCYGSLVHTLDLAAGSKLFGKQANMDVTNPTNNTPGITATGAALTTQQQQTITQSETMTINGAVIPLPPPQQATITATTTTPNRRSGAGILITPANDTTTTTATTAANGNWTMNLASNNNNNNNATNNNGIATTTTRLSATGIALANNEAGWMQRQQQQQDFNNNNNNNNESEYYEARDMKHGHLFVTTSSLLQVARTCKNLTCLNMSLTTLFFDSMIAETGEYVSTLQHYAVQPGLTHILIPMSTVIETLGKECTQLQEVQIQRCDWVTAQTIWLWVTHCPKLVRLDARRSNKCSVKKLIANVLEAVPNDSYPHRHHQHDYNDNQQNGLQQQQQQQQQTMMDDTPMLDHPEEEEERIFFGTMRQRHNHHHHHQNQQHHRQQQQQQQQRLPLSLHVQSQELLNYRGFRDDFDSLEPSLAQRLHQRRGSASRQPSLSRRAAARVSVASAASSPASSLQATTGGTSIAAEGSSSSSSSSSSDSSSSSNHGSGSSNATTEWRSLQQVVYDILKDAKELGADLPWFS